MLHHITVSGQSVDGTCQIGFWRGQHGDLDNVSFRYVSIEHANAFINRMLKAYRMRVDYVDLNKHNVCNHLQFVFMY